MIANFADAASDLARTNNVGRGPFETRLRIGGRSCDARDMHEKAMPSAGLWKMSPV